ncbi:MAG: ribose-5-phosphate isomerase RpiA [Planctomycetota bacterium]|jgi:ribose 5-phosphate isomerase A
MTDLFEQAKRSAGRAAADLVESGMRVGLGSGSTFLHALERLAERQREEVLELLGVASSKATADRARELGIPLSSLDELERLDIAIDGADEIDAEKNMIKGGGAALAREKIVAAAAGEMVVIVGENKVVDVLGKAFPLPVEVLPFGWRQAATMLKALGCEPKLRRKGDGPPHRTDNGNYIVDCKFDGIPDPAHLAPVINSIPGVVDNGLFVGMAGRVFVGNNDGEVRSFE